MNFYLVTYAISYVENISGDFIDDVCHVRFFDNDSFVNSNSFLSQLKQVKKVRVLGVEWELQEVNFEDDFEEISNTFH
jgi:hypothetical protein